MKAMVLAAGLGTRLRPLTDTRPKALVKVDGRTLLEITLARLRAFGVGEVIINVHHFAEMVINYLKSNSNFGMTVEVSREDHTLLDTGGGLKKAAWFFDGDQPFLLHNVDVLSDINLQQMIEFHSEQKALATLAVKGRKASRYLLFDEELRLCGRRAGDGSNEDIVPPAARLHALGFCGIHVISPRLLKLMTEEGAFSIIDTYLRLLSQREKVCAFRADEYYWRDLGRIDDIRQAESDLQNGALG
jgi:NDP-sugar pyrophosphorylase family protein